MRFYRLSALVGALFMLSCNPTTSKPEAGKASRSKDAATAQVRVQPAMALAHAGASSPPGQADGCRKAVDAALAALERGASALDAAVAGVVVLADDPRFNAGTGSRVRIDGETVQMDASVMESSGRFAAVAALEAVRNPVRVARALIDTPHLLLVGDGATSFARTLGMPVYDPKTKEMIEATRLLQAKLREKAADLPEDWRRFDWQRHWNFQKTLEQSGFRRAELGSDTVGMVVRGKKGEFAAALSSGGTSITLRGRVGDVPVFGAGLYAGEFGAIAATGYGEAIMSKALALRSHQALAAGDAPAKVAKQAVEELKKRGSIGILVIGRDSFGVDADEPMAWAARGLGREEWHGPKPAAP